MSELTLIPNGPAALAYGEHVRRLMEDDRLPEPMLYDWRYALERVMAGAWQLWFGFEPHKDPHIMMLTYLSELPAGKICWIELVVGADLLRLADKMAVFDGWCRTQGVALVQSTPKPALAKLLMRNGWREAGVTIFKRLDTVN